MAILQISGQVRRKPSNRAPIERRQQRGKSKRRKTFVANATVEKTLNQFSLDRKSVVHEIRVHILFKY